MHESTDYKRMHRYHVFSTNFMKLNTSKFYTPPSFNDKVYIVPAKNLYYQSIQHRTQHTGIAASMQMQMKESSIPANSYHILIIFTEEVGRRKMGGGSWEEEVGRRKMGGGRWKEEVGRRKMEGGRWEEEVGRRKMGGGRWEEEDGRRQMGGGRWEDIVLSAPLLASRPPTGLQATLHTRST